jgi:hypothetical protein
VIESQESFEVAVHAQALAATTPTEPDPPEDGTVPPEDRRL